MKIAAVNASPRKGWNTDILAEGAAQGGAAVRNLTFEIQPF